MFLPEKSLNLNIETSSEQNDWESKTKNYKHTYSNNFVNMNKGKKLTQTKTTTPYSEERDKSFDHYGFKPKRDQNMNASQFCEMFNSIKNFIMKRLQNTRFGVEVNKLEAELSEFLGHPFDPDLFNSTSFHHFLTLNFSDELEINIKKTVKSKTKKSPSNQDYLIFPKIGFKANLASDQESSFGSFNHSIGSSSHVLKFGHDNLLSDQSQNITKNVMFPLDEYSDHSNIKHTASIYKNQGSVKSRLIDDDDFEIYKSFGYENNGYPFHSQTNSQTEYNVNDTEITNEPEADIDDQIEITQKKFVNYVYDDA